VQFVEQQEIRSTLVLSHIRRATDGDISTRNTQPFAHGHRRKQADGEYESPGLHWLHRQCARKDLLAEISGVSVTSNKQDVILVASAPLTAEAWEPFREGEVVAVSGGKLVSQLMAGETAPRHA